MVKDGLLLGSLGLKGCMPGRIFFSNLDFGMFFWMFILFSLFWCLCGKNINQIYCLRFLNASHPPHNIFVKFSMNYLVDYVGLVWGGGENQDAMVALPTLFYSRDLTI